MVREPMSRRLKIAIVRHMMSQMIDVDRPDWQIVQMPRELAQFTESTIKAVKNNIRSSGHMMTRLV